MVERVNKKTDELCNKFPYVNIIDVSMFERTMYTTHGLHLNYSGKQFLAGKICHLANSGHKRHGLETVPTVLEPKEATPIFKIARQPQITKWFRPKTTEVSTEADQCQPLQTISTTENCLQESTHQNNTYSANFLG